MSSRTRTRRPMAEVSQIKAEIYTLCETHKPLSIRQLFYLMVTTGRIEKTELGYGQVIRMAGEMRTGGEMPFQWIRDDSRRRLNLAMNSTPAEALSELVESYRFDYQSLQPTRLEVWCEKETLSGTLWPTCASYRVDLLPCKGMPSLTYRHEAAMAANRNGRAFKVLYVGDSDPTGELIDPSINSFMRQHLKVDWLGIERVAVTDDQREALNLFTRPPKEKGVRAGPHADIGCVEVEAIAPDTIREILSETIAANLDQDLLMRAAQVDKAQRATIAGMIESLSNDGE